MAKTDKSTTRLRRQLRRHYRKNFKVAASCLADDFPLDEFCWMALSWRTAQMIADIGEEEAASMFERWAALIRDGRFGKFNRRHMSDPDDFKESQIY